MATEPKTRPTDVDVGAFLAAVPDARRRRDAEAIAALMQEVSGTAPQMWGAAIVGFGRYPAASGEWPRLAFSPRSPSLVLYLTLGDARDALMARLAPATSKGGCVYVKDLSKLDAGAVREACAEAWRVMAERHPADA